MFDSLRPCGLQHAWFPCPSPVPKACSHSCASSQWCHPTISSSVIPFSPAFNLSQHQDLFQWVSPSYHWEFSSPVAIVEKTNHQNAQHYIIAYPMDSIWKATAEIINVYLVFAKFRLTSYALTFSVSLLGSPHSTHFPSTILLWPWKQLLFTSSEKLLWILNDIKTSF